MFLLQRCPGCGAESSGACEPCRARLSAAAVPHHRAPLLHLGHTRSLVLGLKYANARHVAHELARIMALSVEEPGRLDVVTWAPTSPRRIAHRGYDPAELLARSVARLLGLPCRRMLYRSRSSGPQAGKDRAMRLHGPRFAARPMWRSRHVLLIDDVTTTGATLREAAEALRRAGAGSVLCLAAAATP